VRIEQLYPFPWTALQEAIAPHPGVPLVWVQEEPENMGAWRFVEPRLRMVSEGRPPLGLVARTESASPASGSATIHEREQEAILDAGLRGETKVV
jgi:2-oxoglutarate dehydrogenase E1 component